MIIDFTFVQEGMYKGTFQVGVDIALAAQEEEIDTLCITGSNRDAEYLKKLGLNTKKIRLHRNKLIRTIQRIIKYNYDKEFKEEVIYVGTHVLNSYGNSASVLHDLYVYDLPKSYGLAQFLYYFLVSIPSCLKKSKTIIVLSYHLKSRLEKQFDINPNRIKIHNYKYRKAKAFNKVNAVKDECSILIVSSGVLNKNKNEIILALRKLKTINREFNVNLVTSNSSFKVELENICEAEGIKIKIFTEIDDEKLIYLYDISTYYLSCSRIEGFGLGVREATLRGCIVIAPKTEINIEASLGRGIFYDDVNDLPSLMSKQSRSEAMT